MSASSLRERVRDEAVRLVDQHPALSRRARTVYKVVKRTYLQAAALGKRIASKGEATQNIYHASIQRTGSRWIRRVFSDPRIQQYSGLWTYPQHEYEIRDHHDYFPKYTFVPGLYISYEQYLRIKKPEKYKTFYVIRDPRDATISWYKSMRNTHKPVNESVDYYRKKFSKLGKKEGLIEAIKLYQVKISFMKDWYIQAKDAPNVFIVKFEDVTRNPKKEFQKIFKNCGIKIPKKILTEVVEDKASRI
jgi:hypothetical protein